MAEIRGEIQIWVGRVWRGLTSCPPKKNDRLDPPLPPRVSKLSVVDLRGEKTVVYSQRVLAIGGAFFIIGQYSTQL